MASITSFKRRNDSVMASPSARLEAKPLLRLGIHLAKSTLVPATAVGDLQNQAISLGRRSENRFYIWQPDHVLNIQVCSPFLNWQISLQPSG
jgi:hypothetical protein